MKITKFLTLALATTFFYSCSSDDDSTTPDPQQPLGDYEHGVLILNEGNFGTDNSTISFLSDDFTVFQSDAYASVNNEAVGNTGQSIGFYENFAFVVVNGSNKIEVLNRYTLEKITTINTGLSNPRYIDFVNGKGYVTNWGDASVATDDFVAVLNLSTYTVESTISVNEGPEKIIEENDKLYIAHKGGYGYGNTISVINPITNSVESSILVADVPTAIEEGNGYIYVLCSGKASWTGDETIAKLIRIDTSDNSTVDFIEFNATQHPSNMAIENEIVYYTLNSVVYKANLNASTGIEGTIVVDLASNQGSSYEYAYGFAVKNNKIWVGDAKDFNSNGMVYVYSIDGFLENEFEVKTSPNGFYFN